jgi:hypothetical protein
MATNEELKMTLQEIMGGAKGLADYQARVAPLQSGVNTPAVAPAVDTEQQNINQAQTDINRFSGYTPGMELPTYGQIEPGIRSQFQYQIDALDRIIADEKSRIARKYAPIIQGRQGSLRGIQAATGQLGQVSGFAQKSELEALNAAEESAAMQEAALPWENAKQNLFGQIRQMASDELKAKREAATQGANAYLQTQKDLIAARPAKVSNAIKAALYSGVPIADNDLAQIASDSGMSLKDVKTSYALLKKEYDAEAEKTRREAVLYGLNVEGKQWDIENTKTAIEEKKASIAKMRKDMGGDFDGYLDETEIKKIDASPQGKSIIKLGDLKEKIKTYKDLVEKYGTSSFGSQKSQLSSAYQDLKIAYKEAAGLGAIQAPDVPIIEGALRNATSSWFGAQAYKVLSGEGKGTIISSLDQALSSVDKNAKQKINELLSRDPRYASSFYVNEILVPFNDITAISDEEINSLVDELSPEQKQELIDAGLIQ